MFGSGGGKHQAFTWANKDFIVYLEIKVRKASRYVVPWR